MNQQSALAKLLCCAGARHEHNHASPLNPQSLNGRVLALAIGEMKTSCLAGPVGRWGSSHFCTHSQPIKKLTTYVIYGNLIKIGPSI